MTPGLHTFRAEIVGGNRIELAIDGTVVLSEPAGTLPPSGRAGIGLWRNGTPDVRVTGFSTSSGAPAILNVACAPAPVVRGAMVTCTASPTNPGDQFTISEWRFEGTELSGPIVEASTLATWSGKAATSGTVRVKGTIGSAPAEGNGPLTVAARTWGSGPDTVAFKIVPLDVTDFFPTKLGALANTQPQGAGFLPPDGFPQIPSGPNNGVFYFTNGSGPG